jgi:hypothetical protein
MRTIATRLMALEQRHTVLLPPMVFFSPTEAELADFHREFPGRDSISFEQYPDDEPQNGEIKNKESHHVHHGTI